MLGFLFDSLKSIFSICILWLIIHAMSSKVFYFLTYAFCLARGSSSYDLRQRLNNLAGPRLSNFRRLLRSQLYCLFASFSGLYLLFNFYGNWPETLLKRWGFEQRICFEIAVSHWIVSIIEDGWSEKYITQHIKIKSANDHIEETYKSGLLWHHIITIFAYSWCLSTHYLSGLCVFGLLFEFPVIWLNIRDIVVGFDDIFQLINHISFTYYRIHWGITYLTWHITRTLPCMLYFWSLIFWRTNLTKVPIYSRIIYHVFGWLFLFINFEIMKRVLLR